MMNRFRALELLEWGEKQNPGPWRAHSLTAARAAEAIANACGMDAERAFVFGALHDIGEHTRACAECITRLPATR